jgi:hypothetical protein
VNRTGCEYDAFTHLRRSLLWSVDRLVYAFTFYADDAGKRDEDDYVVAGGFLGTVAQWERFCSDWRLTLASVGLPFFHATQFFNGADIFAGWNDQKRKKEREELLQALGQIITDYTVHSFTAGVHVPGWLKANEEYMLDEVGFSPFPLAARIAVQRARQWAEEIGHNPQDIECIFDQGCEHWGKLQRRLKVDFDIDAISRDKKKIRPLQAADWLAYEEFREIPKRMPKHGQRSKMRGSYLQLLRVPFDPILFHEKEIRDSICLVPAMKVPARTSEGTGLVRLKYDWRRMKRVGRAYKRLGDRIMAMGFTDTEVSTEEDIPYSSKPRVAVIQAEADIARTTRDAYSKIASGCLERMRIGSSEDQNRLKHECTKALRAEREWTEKHLAALEKLVDILESQD